MTQVTKTAERIQYLYTVLVKPIISEKSTMLSEQLKAGFVVAPEATKADVKEAFEMIFNRQVEKVNILNRKGKEKRFRNRVGRRADRKIAYVSMKAGQELIDLEAEVNHGTN
jgi:large subunit ribosomal protein L23